MSEDTIKVQIEVPKDQLRVAANEAEAKEAAKEPPKEKSDAQAQKTLEVEESAEETLHTLIKEVRSARQETSRQAPMSNPSKSIKNPLSSIPKVKDKSPPNANQRLIIGIGLAIAIAGVVVWPLLGFATGLVVALIGAIIVVFGTFIKL